MRVKDVSKVKLGHDDGLHNGFPILERERESSMCKSLYINQTWQLIKCPHLNVTECI